MASIPDSSRFRLPFEGSGELERNFSQAGQDLFVLSLLDGKQGGVFLDLGCNQPILINNTFLLESQFGWTGLSIDVDEGYFPYYVFRTCKTLVEDCTRLDWDRVIEKLGTTRIDYLSLDLEPPNTTLEGLKNIPFDRVEFSVITFEHDAYRSGEEIRAVSREILQDHGYVRLCSDVMVKGLAFEDWYYCPRYVDDERASVLNSSEKPWRQVIFED